MRARRRGTTVLSRLVPGALLALSLAAAGPAWPQQQRGQPATVSAYSTWVRLSIRGHNQQEIESLLRSLDEQTLQGVKQRLRQTVLTNLRLKRVGEGFRNSRDSDDLRNVRNTIATEIRFAGLQSDEELLRMIEERFGVRVREL